jgi:cell division transport system permease protein
MAVMCYLACLALGALLLINRSVSQWTAGLAQEMTVQVTEVDGHELSQDLNAALNSLKTTAGVISAEDLGEEAGRKLLEPWLGSAGLDKLPVPRLIRVVVDAAAPPDIETLKARLGDISPGIVLDTHQRWADDLRRLALTLELLAIGVLLLIAGSALAMVVMATRAVLEANRQTVDVLHLIGAEDIFVARTLNRRFLLTGIWAGGLGMGLALVTFYALSAAGLSVAGSGPIALVSLPGDSFWELALATAAVPVVATLLALATSRVTLLRMLRTRT